MRNRFSLALSKSRIPSLFFVPVSMKINDAKLEERGTSSVNWAQKLQSPVQKEQWNKQTTLLYSEGS